MSMHISINKNPNMTIYYHGTMSLPEMRYDSEYRWTCTLVYMSGSDSYTVYEVVWDTIPKEKREKAEKRIGKLCLKAWYEYEKDSHKDIIQYQDPGDEQEREYTIADFNDKNIKNIKNKQVTLNKKYIPRKKQS